MVIGEFSTFLSAMLQKFNFKGFISGRDWERCQKKSIFHTVAFSFSGTHHDLCFKSFSLPFCVALNTLRFSTAKNKKRLAGLMDLTPNHYSATYQRINAKCLIWKGEKFKYWHMCLIKAGANKETLIAEVCTKSDPADIGPFPALAGWWEDITLKEWFLPWWTGVIYLITIFSPF